MTGSEDEDQPILEEDETGDGPERWMPPEEALSSDEAMSEEYEPDDLPIEEPNEFAIELTQP